jgi:hypothetical protein
MAKNLRQSAVDYPLMKMGKLFWSVFLLLFLAGCQTAPAPTAAPPTPVASDPADNIPPAAPLVLPTLFPTYTPLIPPTAWPTGEPTTAVATRTPIPFDQIVVSVAYQIPAIGLSRRLEGNLASQIILTDEVTGETVTLSNQPGNLLQMQQALTELTLADRPINCDRCVFIRYQLPAAQIEGEGWLQDLILLASLDHFTAVHLGPHFPPNTLIGLRRNASAFDVSQSLALTNNGNLYIWQGTMDEIPPAQEAAAQLAAWSAALINLPADELERRYTAACLGAPLETLYLGDIEMIIVCPALSLPGALTPLYAQLDAALAAALPEPEVAPPAYPLALSDRLVYQRPDGVRFVLDEADQARVFVGETAVLTTTFPLTATTSLSMTLALQESGALGAGVAALESEWPAFLILRGPLAVGNLGWDNEPPAALRPLLAPLYAWLSTIIEEE